MAAMKVFSLALFLVTGLVLALVSHYWFRSTLAGAISLCLWLLNYHGYTLAASLYETCLAALLVVGAAHVTALVAEDVRRAACGNRLGLLWGGLLGCLPLARPEASLLTLLYFAWVVIACWYIRPRWHAIRSILVYGLVSILVAGPYFAYMYFHVGTMALSSMFARKLLAETAAMAQSHLSIIRSTASVLYSDYVSLSLSLSALASLYSYWSNNGEKVPRHLQRLLIVSFILYAAPFLVTDTTTWGYTIRYLFPTYGLLTILAGVGLSELLKPLSATLFANKFTRILTLGLVMMISFFLSRSIVLQMSSLGYAAPTLERVLGIEEGEALNELTLPSDKVLIYEIQTQYYMTAEAVSLDGIVGGEIIPYLQGKGSLIEFLCKHDYLAVSNAFNYRKELNRTILKEIYERDKEIYERDGRVVNGQTISIGPLVLTKVWERSDRNDVEWWAGAALSIYKISCLTGNQ